MPPSRPRRGPTGPPSPASCAACSARAPSDRRRAPPPSPDAIARPTRDDLIVDGARFALTKFANPAADADLLDTAGLVAAGPRPLTKRVLFPVRFLFTAATGEIGRNEAAVEWYVGEARPAAPLVRRAGDWRRAPVVADEAVPLLAEHLPALYLEFVDEHARLKEAMGEPDLARQLRAWADALGRHPAGAGRPPSP